MNSEAVSTGFTRLPEESMAQKGGKAISGDGENEGGAWALILRLIKQQNLETLNQSRRLLCASVPLKALREHTE